MAAVHEFKYRLPASHLSEQFGLLYLCLPREIMKPFSYLLLVSFALIGGGCGSVDTPNSPTHVEAKERFKAVAAGGFNASEKGVKAALKACFLKGDLVANYEQILATGNRQEIRKPFARGEEEADPYQYPRYVYRWEWDDGLDGRTVDVYVGGDPPIIVATGVSVWPK